MNSRKTVMSLEEKWRLLIRETESGRGSSFSGRLWALPPLDIHSCAMDEIRKHLSVSSRLTGPDDIRIDLSRIRHQTRLTIIARDRPGLFSMITGVLAVNRLDIVSAKIFTWHDGTVVDTFHVLPPWSDYNDWQGMEDQLSDYLHSRSDLGERLSRIRDLKSSGPALNTAKASAVEIDNDTSDFFSIIDVKAPKRTTLVYDISRAISGLGLDIQRAFLSRNSDLLSSVFYVADANGEKITGQDARQRVLEKIREATATPEIHASPERQNTL
jgi:[protein-PII] uridylyltransferase